MKLLRKIYKKRKSNKSLERYRSERKYLEVIETKKSEGKELLCIRICVCKNADRMGVYKYICISVYI